LKALIVYDSLTGQTEKIAQAISSGMMEVGFVDYVVKKVSNTTTDDFKQADVWVVGSPTHLSTATRHIRNALRDATKAGAQGKKAVVFDTRIGGVEKGSNDKVVPILTEAGVQVLFVESFLIVSNHLDAGEEMKAVTLGRKIAGALRP
jgi:flavorubredoxin